MSTLRLSSISRKELISALLVITIIHSYSVARGQDKLILNARSRVETTKDSGEFITVNNRFQWNLSETVVIVCDMWDQHWCTGASQRVAQLAPRINEFVSNARDKGVLIVHAPSDTINYYKEHPARKYVLDVPKAKNPPKDVNNPCGLTDVNEKAAYPIDQSDGGCDCQPKCKVCSPWRKQIDVIEIRDVDAITDSGEELWHVFEQRGIKNVIMVGVHTNMCVLGRSFGLRNMVRCGKNVVLVRDLTDTMYNQQMWPYVSHFTGTDLIVEHIEKYVCPTIASTELTGRPPSHFKDDNRPVVVLISAEGEYDSNRSLPELAHTLAVKYDMHCELLQAGTDKSGNERNYIPGMEALVNADLVVLFVRRRALPTQQMQYLRDYLESGKPLIALRTSSHAFTVRGEVSKELQQWANFDCEVLGCHYTGYPRGETLVTIVPEAVNHPILKGLKGPYHVRETMYQSLPLAQSCQVLMMGKCVDGESNEPRFRKKPNQDLPDQPIAWVNTYKGARIFYTSLGSGRIVRASFRQPWFHRMLTNAVFWAMDKPAKVENTTTDKVKGQ